MDESRLQHAGQARARRVLRVGGVIALAGGVTLTAVAVGSVVTSGLGDPPRLAWMAFVGMPLIFVGTVMCMFGFLGAAQRYFLGETMPAAKDAVNYIAINTHPGMRAAASAITQGALEGRAAHQAAAGNTSADPAPADAGKKDG